MLNRTLTVQRQKQLKVLSDTELLLSPLPTKNKEAELYVTRTEAMAATDTAATADTVATAATAVTVTAVTVTADTTEVVTVATAATAVAATVATVATVATATTEVTEVTEATADIRRTTIMEDTGIKDTITDIDCVMRENNFYVPIRYVIFFFCLL